MDCEFTTESPVELISIGSVILDNQYNILDEFYSTVKPKEAIISNFCSNITHLTNQDIEKSPNLIKVLNSFEGFIKRYKIEKIFVWGNFDTVGLKAAMKCNQYYGYFYKNLNKIKNIQPRLSKVTSKIYKNNSWGLKDMKYMYGLEKTVKHNALSDARDLAEIFKRYHTESIIYERTLELAIDLNSKELENTNKTIKILNKSIYDIFIKLGNKNLKLIRQNLLLEQVKERDKKLKKELAYIKNKELE